MDESSAIEVMNRYQNCYHVLITQNFLEIAEDDEAPVSGSVRRHKVVSEAVEEHKRRRREQIERNLAYEVLTDYDSAFSRGKRVAIS
jgi:hypothetical protein